MSSIYNFQSSKQILITGCYRSGTEYLTHLLGNHPSIAACMYLTNYMRNCYASYDLTSSQQLIRLVYDVAYLLKARYAIVLQSDSVLDILLSAERVTHSCVYDALMFELCLKRTNASVWAEKTQLVWSKIPDFLSIMPNGHVIHVLRDPRSVLASFKKYTIAPHPLYLGAIFNCLSSMLAATRLIQHYPSNQYQVVRYEDLALHPSRTLKGIFSNLGLSSSHNLTDSSAWLDNKGNRWHSNSIASNNTPIDINESIHRWRSGLTEAEVALCETICDSVMKHLCYETSAPDVPWPHQLRLLAESQRLLNHLQSWLLNGEGCEEFPLDPAIPSNWPENVHS